MTCSICAADIPDCIPEYFCGSAVNPACNQFKNNANLADGGMTPDPFDSFFESEMPNTMVSHWTPAFSHCKQNLLYIHSLRAHYELVPDHGGLSSSLDMMLFEMQRLMDTMDKFQNFWDQS